MTYTIIIIIITVLISIAGFNNSSITDKLILWPRRMDTPAEYYRLLSSGFIHADWNHLFFNMFALYMFGRNVEDMGIGQQFLVLYLTGIIISSLPSFLKNRNNSYYRSLGASGGVASLIFFVIYYFPWSRIGIIFLPMGIPSVVFGGLYLAYEAIMAKRAMGNVNHGAHFWGAVYGLFFAFIIDPSHGQLFVEAIKNPH